MLFLIAEKNLSVVPAASVLPELRVEKVPREQVADKIFVYISEGR